LARRTMSARSGDPRRPLRADARRNYDLLLAAAKEVFDEQGIEAPLDDIARRAGVGNATMYRHFPARTDLIIAVYSDEVAALCDEGEVRLSDESPDDALFDWLRVFVTHVATKRELALGITDGRGVRRSALFDRWHESMRSTASALLTRAQRTGSVRADLDVADLLALANGIAVAGPDPGRIDRLLFLVRHGTNQKP
jgi:AcrR family transcriptional regulator